MKFQRICFWQARIQLIKDLLLDRLHWWAVNYPLAAEHILCIWSLIRGTNETVAIAVLTNSVNDSKGFRKSPEFLQQLDLISIQTYVTLANSLERVRHLALHVQR